MLELGNFIIFIVIDAIFVNAGILLSFYVRFLGKVPSYNLNGYEGLYLQITFLYFICILFYGLYLRAQRISYYKIIVNSFKIVVTATILSLAAGYIFLDERVMAFPTTVFLISIPVIYLYLVISRFAVKKYNNDIGFYNRIVEYCFWRIPEIIIVCASIMLSLFIKYGTFNISEITHPGFGLRIVSIFSIAAYIFFITVYRLSLNVKDQWNLSVIYVVFKTVVSSVALTLCLNFIVRGNYLNFPVSVIFGTGLFNLVLLSVWHIAIRKIPLELSVDLNAEDEPTEEETCEGNIEHDNFNLFWYLFVRPGKFIKIIQEDSCVKRWKVAAGMFITGLWMILVYQCFMPPYIRVIFKNRPIFTNPQNYYVNNFRIFALVLLVSYLLWIFFNYLQLIIERKDKFNIKKMVISYLFVYGSNMIWYLIVILSGVYIGKIAFAVTIILLKLWFLIINSLILKKLFDSSIVKVIRIQAVSIILTFLISGSILYKLYL